MIALILAGGGGTRLWPVSRRKNPKQVEAIIGDRSLLQTTYARLRRGFPAAKIFVAAGIGQQRKIAAQLPQLPAENLILEPCRRDTAAAVGFALLRIAQRHPGETFVVINSDAYIQDVPEYLRVIRLAGRLAAARPENAVLIGIAPDYPETGYGYIKTGRRALKLAAGAGRSRRTDFVFAVEKFVEKPDLATAREYLAHGGYLWNPTLVVGRIDRFLELYGRYLPRHAALFRRMAAAFGTRGEKAAIDRLFARLPSVSIDYGILEKERSMLVLPAAFGWADVGNWRAVKEVLSPSRGSSVVKGLHVGHESSGNIIYSPAGKLVATIGVSDMVIIDTGDTVLVCPQDRAQDVKQIVSQLEGCGKLKKFI
ncbi:MAG: sugar phosphate nucleotidyltransferase [Patescibacteria group bacterium]|jgi:mannose-1-phosphate guanylyltransferase